MYQITRREFIRYSSTAAAIASSSILLEELFFSRKGQSATLPNILLITADDLGQTVGCYGDPKVPTPNIDNLSRQGIRFRNSYVTNASCSSSRSSILTGLYPHQTGYFLPNRTPVGQIGLAYSNSGYAMNASVVTLPQILKANGYRTGIIGKLHVYPESSFPFDYKLSPTEFNNRNIELIAQRAGEFFQQQPQPFFLMVSYSDPHEPYFAQVNGYPRQPITTANVQTFPWMGWDTPYYRERVAGYYNGVARLDAGIGLLLNKLAVAGRSQDTIVVFLGDHGPAFPRAKLTCYEAGLRIPFLIRWHNRVSPNRVNNSFVSTVDIFPTLLRAIGLNIPQNIPGRSLLPILLGKPLAGRPVICAEYTSHTRADFNPRRSIRGQRFKYIVNLTPSRTNGKSEELYNLSTDPYEFKNLAGNALYQNSQNFLRNELLKWRRQTADPLLDPVVLEVMRKEHFG